MEFDPREKAIVLTASFLANDAVKQVPSEVLTLGLQMILSTRGIKLSTIEIQDMIDAIRIEQQNAIKEGFGFLEKHKDHLK
jgi:hypothetical protein